MEKEQKVDKEVEILIVEDEMIIAATTSLYLENLGYKVVGIFPRAEEALEFIKNYQPDIILLDIQLKGEMNGIALAEKILLTHDIPIIYVTANTDDAHFNQARATRPYAFISKPFKKLDLQRAIELTLSRLKLEIEKSEYENEAGSVEPLEDTYLLKDRIFIRHKERLIKIFLEDIQYVEAERNYCKVQTIKTKYTLSVPLKTLEDKLPSPLFLRVHRSFMVNLKHIDELGDTYLMIDKQTIPINKETKELLKQKLLTI